MHVSEAVKKECPLRPAGTGCMASDCMFWGHDPELTEQGVCLIAELLEYLIWYSQTKLHK